MKEALAAELVPVIWWFVTHCRVVEEEVVVGAGADGGNNDEEEVSSWQFFLGWGMVGTGGLIGHCWRRDKVRSRNRQLKTLKHDIGTRDERGRRGYQCRRSHRY